MFDNTNEDANGDGSTDDSQERYENTTDVLPTFDELIEDSQEEDQLYSFVEDGDEEENAEAGDETADQPPRVTRWSLGSHSTADDTHQAVIDEMMDNLDDDVDENLMAVLEDASEMVEASNVSNFECAKCGLNHGHSDEKHDIRRDPDYRGRWTPGFNVTDEFADQMVGCPYCHCGANELAMLMDFFGFFTMPVFADQEQFEGVLELPNHVLQDVFRQREDITPRVTSRKGGDFDPEAAAMEEAVREAGFQYSVPDMVIPELVEFYERYRDIKSAANNAPIPSEFRSTVEENRAQLEEFTA